MSLVIDAERSTLMEKKPEAVAQYQLMFNALWVKYTSPTIQNELISIEEQ